MENFVLLPKYAALNTFQMKFLHSREVVTEKEEVTKKKRIKNKFVHTHKKKPWSNMHFYGNFCPFECSDSRGCMFYKGEYLVILYVILTGICDSEENMRNIM